MDGPYDDNGNDDLSLQAVSFQNDYILFRRSGVRLHPKLWRFVLFGWAVHPRKWCDDVRYSHVTASKRQDHSVHGNDGMTIARKTIGDAKMRCIGGHYSFSFSKVVSNISNVHGIKILRGIVYHILTFSFLSFCLILFHFVFSTLSALLSPLT